MGYQIKGGMTMTIQTNAADRRELARRISEHLGQEAAYQGAPTFDYRIGVLVVTRDGSITSEDTEALEALKPFLIEQGLVEPEAQEAERIDEMEISVPAEGMSIPELTNLANMLYSKQYLLNRAVDKDVLRIPEILVQRLAEEPPEGVQAFTDLLDDCRALGELEGFDCRDEKVTLRFPFDEAQPERWVVYGELTHRIVKAAREATRVKPTLLKPDNEKYFMRNWLIRLGYGGSDSKAARHILLGNLKGYAAFKNDADMDRHKAKYAELRRAEREMRDGVQHEAE